MDRAIVYLGALPQTQDILNTNKFGLLAQAFAMRAVLGDGPNVAGLVCAPTSPATLQVTVGAGTIYQLDEVDATAYGDLGVDTHVVLKQGILRDPVTLTLTPPSTPGYSQIFLVQAILFDQDGGSQVLPYYNAVDPSAPLSGPAGAGTSQYTIRTSTCAIALKAGAAAATGSQVAPNPDAGYVGLFQISTAYGQTTITGANIVTLPAAPFFPTLPAIPRDVQNGLWVGFDDQGTQNNYIIYPQPAITGLQKYQKWRVKIANANTGPSNLTVNGFTGSIYQAGYMPSQLPANAVVAGQFAEFICDGTSFELLGVTAALVTLPPPGPTTRPGLVNVQLFTSSGTYIPTIGAQKALAFTTAAGGSGATNCSPAPGGGAGATAIALVSLTGVSSVPVTIGAGGAPVPRGSGAINGNNGGNSSFGTYAVAGGGQGGQPASNAAGQGGVATTGLMLITGGDGHGPNNMSGNGGASFWGGGGEGLPNGNQPPNARCYGSGGAGVHPAGNPLTSGGGMDGVCLVLEF